MEKCLKIKNKISGYNKAMNLKNKVVVITGASDGLGKQVAKDIAKEGAKVILIARTESKLISVKKEIEEEKGEVIYFVGDVSDVNKVTEISKKIMEKYGTIDILINNAGIYFEGATTDINDKQVFDMFNTNTLGTIYFTKACLPKMIEKNQGQILNVISVAGAEPYPDSSLYSSSKWAITGFNESLIKELVNTKIKIMGIYPGGMNTNIFATGGCDYSKNEPWMMKVEDVSKIVLFMLQQPDDINLSRIDIKKIEF